MALALSSGAGRADGAAIYPVACGLVPQRIMLGRLKLHTFIACDGCYVRGLSLRSQVSLYSAGIMRHGQIFLSFQKRAFFYFSPIQRGEAGGWGVVVILGPPRAPLWGSRSERIFGRVARAFSAFIGLPQEPFGQ